jgi:hypothetical protein
VAFDLARYRELAERFCEEIDREWLMHLSGRQPGLEIEAIYDRHAELFERPAVERLRELAAHSAGGDEGRRLRELLRFAFEGALGRETRAEQAEAARLEAGLQVETESEAVPYRRVSIEQANEPDGDRRAALGEARDALLVARLNPIHLRALERARALCRDLGWTTYAEACSELRGVDLEALGERAAAFLRATDPFYEGVVGPLLDRAGLPPLGELARSDLPRFFRAPALDGRFPAARLIPALRETLSGLGIDLDSQPNVHLDVESRPTKSPRAFCSIPRVPEEVHLVIAPVGGRDDYEALFHEAGHAEHYAHVDSDLPFEFRHLGDNAVTESFAFLFQHLTEDGEWLRALLATEDPEAIAAQARAARLVLLRRYAVKIAYELELHGDGELASMPARYSELLGAGVRVRWPQAEWLADVDEGFYIVCYLRAWSLETRWRAALRERFGERWFEAPGAGRWLRGIWSEGQRLSAEELLASTVGGELDFAEVAGEMMARPGRPG